MRKALGLIGRLLGTASLAAAAPSAAGVPEPAHGWAYETEWLAVRSDEVMPVLAALGLERARQVPWNEGVYPPAGQVFITPPLDGWVLVQSGFLAFPSLGSAENHDYGPALRLLERLSDLPGGEAHYYGTHRLADGHAWAVARDGRVVRAFNIDGSRGEVGLARGDLTEAERALGLVPPAGEDASARFGFLLDAGISIDEEWPRALAASWSIDPLAFGASRAAPPTGWIAEGPGAG